MIEKKHTHAFVLRALTLILTLGMTLGLFIPEAGVAFAQDELPQGEPTEQLPLDPTPELTEEPTEQPPLDPTEEPIEEADPQPTEESSDFPRRAASSGQGTAFSPDGAYLAAAQPDGLLLLWDLAEQYAVSFMRNGQPVSGLAFSPDGTTLAAGLSDEVALWDPHGAFYLRALPTPAPVRALAFSPDGASLAAALSNGSLIIWRLPDGTELARLDTGAALSALAFSPDGASLAAGGTDGVIRLLDARNLAELDSLPTGSPLNSLAFAPDSSALLAALDSGALLWNFSSADSTPLPASAPASAAIFAPNAKWFAIGASDGSLTIFDADTLDARHSLAHLGAVSGLATAPSGPLAAAMPDGTLHLWDAASGQPLMTLLDDSGTPEPEEPADVDETATTDETAEPALIETPTPEEGEKEPDTEPTEMPTIIGGQPADEGEWPWQVALVSGKKIYDGQFCGGSLVSDSHVVTAAHCLDWLQTASQVDVVAGVYNLVKPKSGFQRRKTSRYYIHSSWNPSTTDNDIGLIRLDKPVKLGGSGATATAAVPLDSTSIGSGVSSWVTGWGNINASNPVNPDKLHEVNLSTFTNAVCNDAIHWNGKITGNMLCAGYDPGGKGACHGDSGGPMVRNTGGAWKLIGIVSWGSNPCAQANKPSVFTRVSNYVTWINGLMSYVPPASPTAYSPSGSVNVWGPSLYWSEANGTSYNMEMWMWDPVKSVWKRTFNKNYAQAKYCGNSTCGIKYPKQLKEGSYFWRVRVKNGNVWSAWSNQLSFNIAFSSFLTDFNYDYAGWTLRYPTLTKPWYGGYNWWNTGSHLDTWYGADWTWASTSRDGYYSNLDYEVRMARTSGPTFSNGIMIRGNPKLVSKKGWRDGYQFVYARAGYWSVWRIKGGKTVALQPWTYSTSINQTSGGYNTLRVVANGPSMTFYINGTPLWVGSDSTLTSGVVGVVSFLGEWDDDKLSIDYASMVQLAGLAAADAPISLEQLALNEAARLNPMEGGLEGPGTVLPANLFGIESGPATKTR